MCGNWDVAGDLFTVNARTETEKRFQMFYFLKRNPWNPYLAFSVQPGGRIMSGQENGIWTFYLSFPFLSDQYGNEIPVFKLPLMTSLKMSCLMVSSRGKE